MTYKMLIIGQNINKCQYFTD